MPVWGQLAGFLSVIIAIIAAVYKITRSIDRIDHRIQRLELRIASLEGQHRAFLKTWPKIISALVEGRVLSSNTGIVLVEEALSTPPMADLFKDINPTFNPLSQADIDTIRGYVERLKAGQPLTATEAQDFYRIADIITHEYPANENSWLLFLIAGFVLGLMLSKK
jgi:hypothetical protein